MNRRTSLDEAAQVDQEGLKVPERWAGPAHREEWVDRAGKDHRRAVHRF